MAIDTVAALHEELAKCRLLEPTQWSQIARLNGRGSDPRQLARELVQRGWLTPYQVNQLFGGNARDLVLGHYVLLERLGEGGMGQVFKARHATLGRVVALKVIRKEKITDPEAVGRFRREMQAVAQLSHPNVVAAIDADQTEDAHFLVMEYVEGIDLGRLVREKGPLPVPVACEYIRQVALGLQHAHERGLIHRDVKPSNLLVAKPGPQGSAALVKVLDLGLARLQHPPGEDPSALTQIGVVVGTPDYMSPEQARNASRADIRSDLYSLGCTFYFLLTGKVPFKGDTATEKLIKHCFEPAPPIDKLRPDVPPRVCKIVERLMAKEPDARYQTPAKLVVALSRPGLLSRPITKPLTKFLAGILGTAGTVRPDAPERLRKAAGRRRWLRLTIAGGALLVLFLLGFGLLLWLICSSAPVAKGTPAPTRSDRVPADQLDPKSIPPEERLPWQPKELVGVVGKNRARPWGQPVALAVSPDGRTIATASASGFTQLWDGSTLLEVALIREETSAGAASLAFAPDGKTLAMGGNDGLISLWNVTNRNKPERKTVLRGHRGAVPALTFSPDGTLLASGSADDTIRLWDPARTDRTELFSIKGDESGVLALDFSRDGKSLASGGRDHKLRLWNLTAGKLTERWVVVAHPDHVTAVAFVGPGDRIASSSYGRLIRVWNAMEGKQLAVFDAARGNNAFGVFSRDGLHFAGAPGPLAPIHVWDLSGTDVRDRFNQGLPGPGSSLLAFAQDHKTLVSSGLHRLIVWDVSAAKPRVMGSPRDDMVDARSVAFASDGRTLATGGANGRLRLWDLGGAEPVERFVLDAHTRTIAAVKFAADGKLLASAGYDSSLRVWDLSGSKPIEMGRFADFSGMVMGFAFTADGKRMAAGSYDRTIHLYDVKGGKVTAHGEPLVNPDHVVALAMDPSGQMMACLIGDFYRAPTVRLWDLTANKPRVRTDIRIPKIVFSSLALSSDGHTLAAGTTAGSVRLWDLTSVEPRERGEWLIPAARGAVSTIAFTPDGQTLAASVPGRLLLCDVGGVKLTREWDLPGPVDDIAFGPEGRHLVTANSNGTVSILRLAPPR